MNSVIQIRADTPAPPVTTSVFERFRVGDADLLVLGSRGLHGLKTLGSVFERAAHAAPRSVPVVRNIQGQAVGRKEVSR